jgi:hypothetical protein
MIHCCKQMINIIMNHWSTTPNNRTSLVGIFEPFSNASNDVRLSEWLRDNERHSRQT